MRRRSKKEDEVRLRRLKESIEKAERNIRMGKVVRVRLEELPAYQRYLRLKAQRTRGVRPEDLELAKRFPLLLAEMLTPPDGPMNTALRLFGLECGPGWRPLIAVLFEKLEAEIAALPEGECHRYRAVQVKEKFGGLRVYLNDAPTEAMREAIEDAKDTARGTCDVCSMSGTPRNAQDEPIATRCELHVMTRVVW